MSRATQILQQLELTHAASAVELARLHGVGLRTIASEVSAINHLLGAAGAIKVGDGTYRLVVVDAKAYKERKLELERADESFNEPESRVEYIIATLFRALLPTPIEALARQMSVGRTTVITDLARAREQLASSDLAILGRPKVGLSLEGEELQKRLYVLRHLFERAYSGETVPGSVVNTISELADRFHLNAFSKEEVQRWARVSIDRLVNGHRITSLPDKYRELANTPAHAFAHALVTKLSDVTELDFDTFEELFLSLPIAGMRTPDDSRAMEAFTPPDDLQDLIAAIMAAVADELDLRIDSTDLVTEFAHHLGYMLNRTRYQIWIDDSGVANIANEYPVAHQMARIAARVIDERLGLRASEPEIAFLAAYFQVFLESHEPYHRPFLRVAIVTGTGRVSARLIEIQLRKVLPASTQYLIIPVAEAMADPGVLRPADLVVTTAGVQLDCTAPVVEIDHVFDRRALGRQLGPLRFGLPGGADLVLDIGTSSLAIALDDQHFFALPADTDYLDAVEWMIRRLEGDGLAEPGFAQRVLERERRSTMRLDPWIAFPHANLEGGNDVLLAVGVIPRTDPSVDDVRLIVLMGLPANPEMGEAMLIAIYDEIIRLGTRRNRIAEISQLTTYEQFFYFMDNLVNDRER